MQTHHGPFDMANLSGASFEDAVFRIADSRTAANLRESELVSASGLDKCVFENEDAKYRSLQAAMRQGSQS